MEIKCVDGDTSEAELSHHSGLHEGEVIHVHRSDQENDNMGTLCNETIGQQFAEEEALNAISEMVESPHTQKKSADIIAATTEIREVTVH